MMRVLFMMHKLRISSIVWMLGVVMVISSCANGDEPAASLDSSPSEVANTTVMANELDLTDPRVVATYIVDHSSQRDVDSLRGLLIDSFQEFSDSVLQRAVFDRYRGDVHHNDWQVETHDMGTTVRAAKHPALAMVFQHDTDGAMQLDPGPDALWMAMRLERNLEQTDTPLPDLSQQGTPVKEMPLYHRSFDVVEGDASQVARYINDSLGSVLVDEDGVTITIAWSVLNGAEAGMPLDGSTWEAESADGGAEVVWTTARLDGERLMFPNLFESELGTAGLYFVSFRLDGAPGGSQVELHIPAFTIDAPDSGLFQLSIEYSFSAEMYPPE
jgi:hypothetical protein